MRDLLKKRLIKVSGITCEGCVATINTALSSLKGVIDVKANKAGTVHIEYDLMKIDLKAIEDKLSELNYAPTKDLLSRIKHGFITYTEENEYNNMHAQPHSCCTLPGEKDMNH